MADSPAKIAPPPPRDPLPPIYPIPLIEVACRALEAVAAVAGTGTTGGPMPSSFIAACADVSASAVRIIRDGLISHELAAKEGRSRG